MPQVNEQLFHHLVKQPVRAYGNGEMEILRAGFEKSGFSIPELIKQIALTAVKEETTDSIKVSAN